MQAPIAGGPEAATQRVRTSARWAIDPLALLLVEWRCCGRGRPDPRASEDRGGPNDLGRRGGSYPEVPVVRTMRAPVRGACTPPGRLPVSAVALKASLCEPPSEREFNGEVFRFALERHPYVRRQQTEV